jgi:multisubunit Na+/H+ antiporter MnhC subunit
MAGFELPAVDAILYSGAIGLIVIGATGLVMSRHLFRIVLSLAIAEAGANMLLVLAGYRWDAVAPILTGSGISQMVDPVPQAMVLTSIVIGVGIQALALSFVIHIYKTYRTLDRVALTQLLEQDICDAARIPALCSQDAPATERPVTTAQAVTRTMTGDNV